ncbi:MAG: Rid family detoxifying hydrolase [Cyclobacteriaceae bacterium]|jgi:2-iminobutanoate/2-iminopropanoate deaminase|nr:Rid family detoxifying hydrolase [Cyclobacteriaceae bacterium]
MNTVFAPDAPKAIGPYCHAIRTGNLIFCSGQTPLNPETMLIEGINITEQTNVVLHNLETVLKAANANRSHIIKTTVFLKNFADFEKMNKAYEAFFGDHKPARTTVEVSRLPKEALVEIECVAEIP